MYFSELVFQNGGNMFTTGCNPSSKAETEGSESKLNKCRTN
jgi:hypothetical protein